MNSYEIWKNEVIENLKGESFEKKLVSKTYEGININPLYTQDQKVFENDLYPGLNDKIRGSSVGSYIVNPYTISQDYKFSNINELDNCFNKEFIQGINEINVKIEDDNFLKIDFQKLLVNIKQNKINLNFDTHIILNQLFDDINKFLVDNKDYNFNGSFLIDVFKILNFNNYDIDFLNQKLYENFKLFYNFKNVKTLGISTVYYQEAGASAIHELAFALSKLVYYVEYFKSKNENIKDILNKIRFDFSIGSNFFMEISKFRAFRALYSNLVKAYKLDQDLYSPFVSAKTSSFNKSLLDMHSNILRTSTEALSAVLGGVDNLNILAFDFFNNKSSTLASRIAKNIGIIIGKECNLINFIDPVGGSYYIDYLTKELIDKAWLLFCDIEDEGGFFNALKNNTINKLVETTYEEKFKNFSKRKDNLIGVNIYPNQNDKILNLEKEIKISKNKYFNSIIPKRISKPYELLNYHLSTYNSPLSLLQINFGDYKQFKLRSDWISSFFEVLRIKIVNNFYKLEDDILNELSSNKYQFAVIVSSDEEYPNFVSSLIKKIRKNNKELYLMLAGQNKEFEKDWFKNGLNSLVNVKTNHYDLLKTILTNSGVIKNG